MSKAMLVAMVLTVWLVAFAPVVLAQQYTTPVDLGAPGCDGNHGLDCAEELYREAQAAGFAQYRDTTPSDPNRVGTITQDGVLYGPSYPDPYRGEAPNGNVTQDGVLYGP